MQERPTATYTPTDRVSPVRIWMTLNPECGGYHSMDVYICTDVLTQPGPGRGR